MNPIMGMDISDSELRHHGIKGMKWGVRRFQDKTGRLTSAGKKRYSKDGKAGENESDEKKPRLSDNQKKAVKIGAAVAATALVAYGGYKLGKSGKLDGFISRGKGSMDLKGINSGIANNGAFKKLRAKESVSEVIHNANPLKSNNNCYNVVVTSALRMAGYDVTANKSWADNSGAFDKITQLFPNHWKQEQFDPTPAKMINYLTKRAEKGVLKEGDVGAIAFSWNDAYVKQFNVKTKDGKSPSHTLNFIIENGKPRFFDSQVSIDHDRVVEALKFGLSSKNEARFVRMFNVNDGLDINSLDQDLLRNFVS